MVNIYSKPIGNHQFFISFSILSLFKHEFRPVSPSKISLIIVLLIDLAWADWFTLV